MAIIIPSKNIYGDITNDKFAVSPVNGVKLTLQEAQPTTSEAYSTSMYVSAETVTKSENEIKEKFDFADHSAVEPYETILAYGYFDNKVESFSTLIRIPKRVDNKFIPLSSIDTDKIKCKYRGSVFKQVLSSNVNVNIEFVSGGVSSSAKLGEIKEGKIETNEYGTYFLFPDPAETPGKYELISVGHSETDYSDTASVRVYGAPFDDIPVNVFEFIEETDNEYVLKITTLGYYYAKVLEGGSGQNNDYYYRDKDASSVNYTLPVSGYVEILKADVLEITGLEGIGIDVRTTQTTIGQKSGNIASLNGNELLQKTTITNDQTTSQFIANKILSEYGKGKETAEIICAISDYYDSYGNKVISKEGKDLPLIFSPMSSCIPFIMNEFGNEVPLSKYKYKQPKSFEIVGVELLYDGAVFQKLYLEETSGKYSLTAIVLPNFYPEYTLFLEGSDVSAEVSNSSLNITGIAQAFIEKGELYIY